MRIGRLALSGAFLASAAAQATQWPVHDNGLNKVIQWDHYSLIVKGERLFVWSGELHYWRIPVPGVWRDLLEKVKAAGFNTVAFYASWAYHAPTPNTTDFSTGAHDINTLFTIAQDVGLYVIFRPGPYINAETNAGGFPGWVTRGDYGALRDDDPRYTAAWTPYMTHIGEIVSKHLITRGGNVILYQLENEIGSQFRDPVNKVPNPPSINYMIALEKNARAAGIDVPLFTNAPNARGRSWSKDYSNVGGEQDIYGLDSYPNCWSCDLTECGNIKEFNVVDYASHFALVSPTQPSFLPEFQGGSYNPWGGPQGGCRANSDTDFVNLFYRDNIAQRVTMHSLYMLYGGTNWGGFACPLVGTSYDYSSPIQETRLLANKYQETKLIGLQVRAAKDLVKTEEIGKGTSYSDSSLIWTTELRNPDSKAGFYVVRHNPSNLVSTDAFKLRISTSRGNFTIPQSDGSLALVARESKIFSVDYALTGGRTLVYSTAEVLALSTLDARAPIVVLWATPGHVAEFLLTGVRSGNFVKGSGRIVPQADATLVSIPAVSGTSILRFADGLRVIVVDKPSAYSAFVPSLTKDPAAPHNKNLVVLGAHLVRSAKIVGPVVALSGDLNAATTLEVFAPLPALAVTWNGRLLLATRTSYGSLVARYTPPTLNAAVRVGKLNWRVADGLPERAADYDDSKWTRADKTFTPSKFQPDTLPVLYGEEYGIWMGNILWRGRFTGNNATGVFLSVAGGNAMGYSAYLNGKLVGSFFGERYTVTANSTFSFAGAPLNAGENVLLVVQDHTGKGLRDLALIPRGIFNATLFGVSGAGRTGGFDSWRMAATAGSSEGNIDPVRGTLSEGGLHAERLGWHLPGFDASKWPVSTGGPAQGISTDGMAFYRAEVDINVPRGLDAIFAFELDPTISQSKNFRVMLFVNGYQYGKMIQSVGNQIEFPVPPGILNYSGKNTIGLNLWAQEATGAKVGVTLKLIETFDSSWDSRIPDAAALRPGYKSRSKYY
ncbi:hypothetical protein AURDEDRAFT_143037 [Auricularia subglabra TFB-10046 SS5]|nr:hypothetical protein AURDEDRAFT_143037 [Auricularia subglabra TFB-10046 SS5]